MPSSGFKFDRLDLTKDTDLQFAKRILEESKRSANAAAVPEEKTDAIMHDYDEDVDLEPADSDSVQNDQSHNHNQHTVTIADQTTSITLPPDKAANIRFTLRRIRAETLYVFSTYIAFSRVTMYTYITLFRLGASVCT